MRRNRFTSAFLPCSSHPNPCCLDDFVCSLDLGCATLLTSETVGSCACGTHGCVSPASWFGCAVGSLAMFSASSVLNVLIRKNVLVKYLIHSKVFSCIYIKRLFMARCLDLASYKTDISDNWSPDYSDTTGFSHTAL